MGLSSTRRAAMLAALAASFPGSALAQAGSEAWRNSWREFGLSVDAFRRDQQLANPSSPQFPQAGEEMLHRGERTPANWPVMRAFNGAVVFEGLFDGLETEPDSLMAGQAFKIDMNMSAPLGGPPLRGFAKTHIYPSAAAAGQWRALAAGSTVKFRSTIGGIAALGMGGQFLYFVLLTGAAPA